MEQIINELIIPLTLAVTRTHVCSVPPMPDHYISLLFKK